MAGWHWRSKRAGLSGSIATDVLRAAIPGPIAAQTNKTRKAASDRRAGALSPHVRSDRDFTACSDKFRASLNTRVGADDLDDRELVGSGIADAGAPASDRVADDLIAVAAVKPVDHSRQN